MSSFAAPTAAQLREFSLLPFWFWNDQLDDRELLRQIDDFAAHGVHGFVIHPRVGLPRNLGWMSDELLRFMRIAIDAAARRGMHVILYDEGMYPSGSSCGQVVANDPSLACRCLALIEPGSPMPIDAKFVAEITTPDGGKMNVIDRLAPSYIRGLHYIDESNASEDEPPAGDILNIKTTQMVLKLVYDKFHEHFGDHFGKTILGIFTDEPNPLGKVRDNTVRPGTTGIVQAVSEIIGYDFTPHLASLWYEYPGSEQHKAKYEWAIRRRLEQTWYRPLSEWCAAHGVALCGHPDRGDEIGVQRFFQYPGQDLVWRWVLPDHPTALEGPESTQGKCSSSAMIHHGRRRNSNEFCGAYGENTTFDEFKWLANWCLIRGVNLLVPHAFYYSVRGPRKHERPPQVGGVGCDWWEEFTPFAKHCSMLCWMNTDSTHVCDIAILSPPDACPWKAAKVCFENQFDFNYLDTPRFEEAATVDDSGVHIAGMHYRTLIIDGDVPQTPGVAAKLAKLSAAGRVLVYSADEFLNQLRQRSAPVVRTASSVPSLRVRHVVKQGQHMVVLFNESFTPISTRLEVAIAGVVKELDTISGTTKPLDLSVSIELGGAGTCCIVFG